MPRPRKYADPAEKQKAYRLRNLSPQTVELLELLADSKVVDGVNIMLIPPYLGARISSAYRAGWVAVVGYSESTRNPWQIVKRYGITEEGRAALTAYHAAQS